MLQYVQQFYTWMFVGNSLPLALGNTFSDILLRLELTSTQTVKLSAQLFVMWTFDKKACRSSGFMTKKHVC